MEGRGGVPTSFVSTHVHSPKRLVVTSLLSFLLERGWRGGVESRIETPLPHPKRTLRYLVLSPPPGDPPRPERGLIHISDMCILFHVIFSLPSSLPRVLYSSLPQIVKKSSLDPHIFVTNSESFFLLIQFSDRSAETYLTTDMDLGMEGKGGGKDLKTNICEYVRIQINFPPTPPERAGTADYRKLVTHPSIHILPYILLFSAHPRSHVSLSIAMAQLQWRRRSLVRYFVCHGERSFTGLKMPGYFSSTSCISAGKLFWDSHSES